jgi:serine/threonine-protein kinase ULK4
MHRLSHPHIIQFKDWYETKNNLWLILEYCTGGDLQSLLKQDGHIPEASVRMFTLDILAGLKVCLIPPLFFLFSHPSHS